MSLQKSTKSYIVKNSIFPSVFLWKILQNAMTRQTFIEYNFKMFKKLRITMPNLSALVTKFQKRSWQDKSLSETTRKYHCLASIRYFSLATVLK